MPKFSVLGTVMASKWLGIFEADTPEAAIEKAERSRAIVVSVCHQCADQVEDPEVENLTAEEVDSDTPCEVAE